MNTFHFFTPQPSDLLSLTIEGRRLQLVAISDKFEQDIFKYFTSEITRYMFPSPAQDIKETRNFIVESRRSIAVPRNMRYTLDRQGKGFSLLFVPHQISNCYMQIGNNLQFAILSKSTGEFLGCCGLHGEGKVRTPELGIWIKKSAHGSGYGREAVHLLVNWSWNNIDLDYFTYPVDRKNVASSKIPESLGGEVVEALKVETPTGKILDEVVYKINRVKSVTRFRPATTATSILIGKVSNNH